MKTRQMVAADTMYKAVMHHSEICVDQGIAGKLMAFRMDLNDQVFLYDPEVSKPFGGPITAGEAGLFEDGGEWYFHPVKPLEEMI